MKQSSLTKKQRKERNRIITALVIYVILAAGEHILRRMGLLTGVFSSHWVLMIPYLLPYFIAGGDVVKNALIGIKNLQMLDESFLMFIATIGRVCCW
jgi:Cd2+/Zn2+-exporting ATPase